MSFNGNSVWQCADLLRQFGYDVLAVLVKSWLPAVEKRPFIGLEQLDAQTIRRYCHLDVVFELLEIGHMADGLLQLRLQHKHIFFFSRGAARILARQSSLLDAPLGSRKYPPTAA